MHYYIQGEDVAETAVDAVDVDTLHRASGIIQGLDRNVNYRHFEELDEQYDRQDRVLE